MSKAKDQFDLTDARRKQTGLYQTLLRRKLGDICTADDIDDVFKRLKARAPDWLDNFAFHENTDLKTDLRRWSKESGIEFDQALRSFLREPHIFLGAARRYAASPSPKPEPVRS